MSEMGSVERVRATAADADKSAEDKRDDGQSSCNLGLEKYAN